MRWNHLGGGGDQGRLLLQEQFHHIRLVGLGGKVDLEKVKIVFELQIDYYYLFQNWSHVGKFFLWSFTFSAKIYVTIKTSRENSSNSLDQIS